MRDSRRASRSSCTANRVTASGSSSATARSVSAAAWIEAAGVFSSCDALATKSRRTASVRRESVTSVTTINTAPSPAGVAVTRSHRVGELRSMSTVAPRPEATTSRTISRRSSGKRLETAAGREPRCRSSASFANAAC